MSNSNMGDGEIDVERLGRVDATLKRQIETGYIHGAAMRVSLRGKVIVDFLGGYADKAAGLPLQRDSAFITMSTAKPFTAVLALSLVERGLLRLHAPVADVIPEFAAFGKGGINLFHLLTHTSGTLNGNPADPEIVANIEKMTAYASSLTLEAQPGERVSYSMSIAHSVVAMLCLRVAGRGRTYSAMLAEDLFGPLSMTQTNLGPRQDLLARVCPMRTAQEVPYNTVPAGYYEKVIPGRVLNEGAEWPAGGCITTIDDLHRFAEMLRRGGELDGVRVISPAMLNFCARSYTGDKRSTVWDSIVAARHWKDFPANIGIGFRVRGEGIIPGPFGLLNSPGTFGHFGAGSTGVWVDPDRGLAYSLLTTGLLEESHNLERTALLSDLVVCALTQ